MTIEEEVAKQLGKKGGKSKEESGFLPEIYVLHQVISWYDANIQQYRWIIKCKKVVGGPHSLK